MVEVGTKNRVKKNFSKAARQYERLATLQQAIGLKLLARLKDAHPHNILDVGMGTGWLTGNLCAEFKDAGIVGIDFADGMIEHAKKKGCRFKIAQADAAALSFLPESFDLVVSNLVYQWVEDLAGAFGEVYRVLVPDGHFYLNTFGSQTLNELFHSLAGARNGAPADLLFRNLPAKKDIAGALLESGFSDFHVETEHFKVFFSDVPTLMRWLKNIGANTSCGNMYLGKETLARADEFYRKNFSQDNKIYATFEVIWAIAKK